MEVHTRNKDLRIALDDDAFSRRRFGADMAKKLRLRLDALRAAESLADFWPPKSGPERCHELKGGLSGTFSIDLKQPYRLLFTPLEPEAHDDSSDERQRWKSITTIELIGIEDTHG
jgi:plasmid maintenance system killer protein